MRKLDAMVAEKVEKWTMHSSWNCLAPPGFPSEAEMWTPWTERWDNEMGFVRSREPIKSKVPAGVVMNAAGKPKVPHYFTDIAAAWRIVDKVFELDHQPTYLRFRKALRDLGGLAPSHLMCKRICVAALRAVGVSEADIQAAIGGDVGGDAKEAQ